MGRDGARDTARPVPMHPLEKPMSRRILSNPQPQAKRGLAADPPPTRYRSRRRPALRVVGGERDPYRHCVPLELKGLEPMLLEVMTFDEWNALPAPVADRYRDGSRLGPWILPGLGFMFVRWPISASELADAKDECQQAHEDWDRLCDRR